MGYPPLSSNVAGWKIPELNGYYFKAGKIVKRNSGFTANNVWLLEGVFDNFLFEKLVYEQFPQSVAVEKSCNSRPHPTMPLVLLTMSHSLDANKNQQFVR